MRKFGSLEKGPQKNKLAMVSLSVALRIVCVVIFLIRNVFFMRLRKFRDAMQVCVHQCPTSDLRTPQQVRDFADQNNSRLCLYDVELDDYKEESLYTKVGPCPKLPVYKR